MNLKRKVKKLGFIFVMALFLSVCIFSERVSAATVLSDTVLVFKVGETVNLQLEAESGALPYQWSVVDGSLPDGLALSSSGLLEGFLRTEGTYNADILVTDGLASSRAAVPTRFVFIITPRETGLQITPGTCLLTVGQPCSIDLDAEGGETPYTWEVEGPLPDGLEFTASDGILEGTPTVSGTFPVKVTVTDDAGVKASGTLSLIVAEEQDGGGETETVLHIASDTVHYTVLGEAFALYLEATGGIEPYSWEIGGALPYGLVLSGDLIEGSPTTPGSFAVKVQVTDGEDKEASETFTFYVVESSELSVMTETLPNAQVGRFYSARLRGTGGAKPYSWSVEGAPDWLKLDSQSGILYGFPNETEILDLIVRLEDSEKTVDSVLLPLSVYPHDGLAITTRVLPSAIYGEEYLSGLLEAFGGIFPYYFTLRRGTALPPGLTLASAEEMEGAPSRKGVYNFTLDALDGNETQGSRDFTMVILEDTNPLIFRAKENPDGKQLILKFSLPYEFNEARVLGIEAIANDRKIVWRSDSSVTKNQEEPYRVTMTLYISETVLEGESWGSLMNSLALDGIVVNFIDGSGQEIFFDSAADVRDMERENDGGGSGGCSAGFGGLSLLLSVPFFFRKRTVKRPGIFSVTFLILSIFIFPRAAAAGVTITSDTIHYIVLGQAFSLQLEAEGGNEPYTWEIEGTLPRGLNISADIVDGSPTTPGIFPVTVRVADSSEETKETAAEEASEEFAFIVVENSALAIMTDTVPVAQVGRFYTARVRGAGGAKPYVWSMENAPEWLNLDPQSGILSGLPKETGIHNIIFRLTDIKGAVESVLLRLSVYLNEGLTITTHVLPSAVYGKEYTSGSFDVFGGIPPYYFMLRTETVLPTGLALSSGEIRGKATAKGVCEFTLDALDGNAVQGSRDYTMAVLENTRAFRFSAEENLDEKMLFLTFSLPDEFDGAQVLDIEPQMNMTRAVWKSECSITKEPDEAHKVAMTLYISETSLNTEGSWKGLMEKLAVDGVVVRYINGSGQEVVFNKTMNVKDMDWEETGGGCSVGFGEFLLFLLIPLLSPREN